MIGSLFGFTVDLLFILVAVGFERGLLPLC